MTESHAAAAAPDITEGRACDQFFVADPADRDGYMRLKASTDARIGVGRAGTRYTTASMLRFRADHAAARDSVNAGVPPEFIRENGFIPGVTRCGGREEYLLRPDLGRALSDASRETFGRGLARGASALVAVGDGLSCAAVLANAAEVIASLRQGLSLHGIGPTPIPFIQYCRVGAMDDLGPLVGAETVCLLIGERPGLVSAESMSAYMAYRPDKSRPESWRSVVSNIRRGGIPPVEAGAVIAEILARMLAQKRSGVSLIL
jgi:ethanolamine ammonia-lyase small subunit